MSDMLDYVLSTHGKNIRPIIVMLASALTSSANARQWVEGERNCTKRTYLAALMVEMLHTASLSHDDVIDNSNERRGRPSVNALWQSRNAVVLGDYLLARTMRNGYGETPRMQLNPKQLECELNQVLPYFRF